MKRLLGIALLMGSALAGATALKAADSNYPAWAYGVPPADTQAAPPVRDDGKMLSVPGSDKQFTFNKIRGRRDNDTPARVAPADWFPNDHPNMPKIVAEGDDGRGIVGRGVLIDLPALLGRDIRPGETATPSMLDDALDAQQVGIHPGDTVWIRLRRTTDAEPRTPSAEVADEAAPGVSFDCAEQVASWAPAAIITDAGMDPFPSEVEGIPVPWHILLLTALRVPLVDFADLDRVSAECRERRRWDFLSVLAPLPLPGASGSPVNPLALF